MKKTPENSRRKFLKNLGSSAAVAAAVPTALATASPKTATEYLHLVKRKKIAANDNIRIALIGTGGTGIGDVQAAVMVEGVEMVTACDLCDGRLSRCKELWREDIFTTRDYRVVYART